MDGKLRSWILYFCVLIVTLNFIGNVRYLEIHQRKDPHIHPVSMQEPYYSRIVSTRSRCSRVARHSTLILSHRYKYNDQLKSVYCATPKVASTTWKLLFLQLASRVGNMSVEEFREIPYDDIPNTHFAQLDDETMAWARLHDYMTFYITRHPFERLVSAFNDKLTSKTPITSYRDRVGVMIAKEQADEYMHGVGTDFARFPDWVISRLPGLNKLNSTQKQQVFQYLRVLRTGEVPFVQFVRYIIKEYKEGRGDELDVHWLPQVRLCHPCSINYKFIMRFETLFNDSTHLLEHLQTGYDEQSKIKFPQRAPARQQQIQDTKFAFGQISQSEIDTLKLIYKDDFALFNYDPDEYDKNRL
uniref:Carbohydrate sulfotransferase n=1 Tax=Ciona savignyi TaxID=51511 RepID=H2Z6A4_CIOSA